MKRLNISCDVPTIQMMSREMRKTPENAAEETFGELSVPGIGNNMQWCFDTQETGYTLTSKASLLVNTIVAERKHLQS